jgi:hypothetical protein
MHRSAQIRLATSVGLAIATSLLAQTQQRSQSATATQAQSTLPATPPTAPEVPQVPLTPQQRPPQRAQVTYADGALSISADNSSLNQILRQIANDTGMKITGGVADERVFGKYGPAQLSQVLGELLDGTGSNMILVHREGEANPELILTPRMGGPSPPNPNAQRIDDRPERAERPEPPQPEVPQPLPASTPVNPPVNSAAPDGTSPANPAQPDSPNGVKTPQQIYEQLQRMRQQQQTPQTPPATPPQ